MFVLFQELKIKEEEIEEAREVFPDEKNNDSELFSGKTFENKFDESCENVRNEKNSQFEGSVNFKSSSSEKSSSLKTKEMPIGESSPIQKRVGVARPVAAVSPFTPKDDSDDNCDNTDPKTVVKSKLSNSNLQSSQGADSEQTFVKGVYSELNHTPPTSKQHTEQMQRSLPPQMLTKSSEPDNSGNYPFSRARFTDPNALFYTPNARIVSNEGESSGPGRREVTLGNDPLSRDTQEGMVQCYGTPV